MSGSSPSPNTGTPRRWGAARGVQLRNDHGSCFMAEDFHTQLKAWDMTPSYAFASQLETNGVIERFFRTLKEQVVHDRVFQSVEDVRNVVRDFIARYNAQWLVKKNGYLSPHAMRRQRDLATILMVTQLNQVSKETGRVYGLDFCHPASGVLFVESCSMIKT